MKRQENLCFVLGKLQLNSVNVMERENEKFRPHALTSRSKIQMESLFDLSVLL